MFFHPGQATPGAEAEVWSGTWMGKPAISKTRRNRAWRHPDLEKRLGYRRMISEARILLRLRDDGLPVPALWDIDLENGIIVMQKMNGRPLIDILRDENLRKRPSWRYIIQVCGQLLHRMAVTHGDLSTNILIDEHCNAFLIDFGLSAVEYEVERFGIDLHVMDEILDIHPNISDGIETFWPDTQYVTRF